MFRAELNLPNGGRWDIWLRQVEYIEKFISEYKLRPIAAEHLQERFLGAHAKSLENRQIIWDPGIAGGIRLAHLHYKGDIYLINDKQWDAFSKKVIADCQARLANVKTVGFDNLMQCSQAVEAMH